MREAKTRIRVITKRVTRTVKGEIINEPRFFLEYVLDLKNGGQWIRPVGCEPRGWKTLRAALRKAEQLGLEVENPDQYA